MLGERGSGVPPVVVVIVIGIAGGNETGLVSSPPVSKFKVWNDWDAGSGHDHDDDFDIEIDTDIDVVMTQETRWRSAGVAPAAGAS